MGSDGAGQKILKLLSRQDYGLTIEEVAAALSINRMTAAKYLAVLGATNKISVRNVGRAKLHYPKRRNGDKWLMNGRKKSSCGMTGAVSAITIILVVTATLLLAAMTNAESNDAGAFAISVTKDYSENVIILQIIGPASTNFSLVMVDPENKTITPRERVVFTTDEKGGYELRIIGYVPGRYVASIEANGKTYVQGFEVEPFLDAECNRSFLEYVYDVNDSSRELNGSVAGEYVWDVCRDFVEANVSKDVIISQIAENRVFAEIKATENASSKGESGRSMTEYAASKGTAGDRDGESAANATRSRVFLEDATTFSPAKKSFGKDDHPSFVLTAKKKYYENAKITEKGRDVDVLDISVMGPDGEPADVKTSAAKRGEGETGIEISGSRAFRPGRFTIRVRATDGNGTFEETGEFLWGVLSINTHKSIYLENEEAFIGMAILDDEGRMTCDAVVTLAIMDSKGNTTTLRTSDGTISVSPECNVYGVTNLPDYYAYYSVNTEGNYTMELTAVTGNGERTLTDTFEVRKWTDFSVERKGPTRIYPPVKYSMIFTITPYVDYAGPVSEYVPSGFDITPQEGVEVRDEGDAKVLTWNANFSVGGEYEIGYEFDAPDISPYLFTLGPLEIGGWNEARDWMIASDTVSVWRPTNAIHSDASNVTSQVNASENTVANVNKNQYVTVSSWNETLPTSRLLSQVIAKVEIDAVTNGAEMSILTNNSGSFLRCGSCVSIAAGTLTCNLTGNCSIDTSSELNGLNLRVNDSDPGGASGSTATVDYIYLEVTWDADGVAPVATMGTNPIEGYTDTDGDRSVTFDVKCTDNSEVGAIQLWGNWTGTWAAIQTNSTPTSDSWWNVTVTGIPEGTWKWDAWCNDTAGNSDWSDVNRTLTVTVGPAVTASAHQSVRNATAVNITATITDTEGVSVARAMIYYPNGSFWQNATMASGGDSYKNNTVIVSFYPQGTYNVTIWVNDTGGRINSSEKTSFASYALLSDDQEIVINGSFSGWGGVDTLLDNATDAGGPNVVDNELLLAGLVATGNISVFSYNSTTSHYDQVWNDYNASVTAGRSGAVMGDINHDGRNEFVIMRGATTPTMKLEVWAFNVSSQGWYRQWVGSTIFTTGNSYIGDIADVDNDTYADMIVTNDNTHAIEIWGNDTANATGYAYNATIWTNSSGCYYPKVSCDLNGNGIPEIIAQCRFESRAQIYEWNGASYAWLANLTLPLGGTTAPQIDDMDCGDVDKDSEDELVACGNMGISAVIDYSGGSYSIAYYSSYGGGTSSYTQTCSIADVTNDGWPDWFDVSKDGLRVFSNDGTGYANIWNSTVKYSTNPPIGASGAGDSDNDGRGELIYGNATAPIIAFLWENDTSPALGFANTLTWDSSSSLSVIIGDLDNNGSAPGRDVNFEIANFSLANNASYLFARIGVNGSITLTDGTKYYRMFVSVNDSTGNQTTPEGDALPFKYDYRIQVNGSQCYVFNSSYDGNNKSSCLFGYAGGQLEIAVNLSVINLSAGRNANITFETGSSASYDFAPDYPSFVSYDVPGGDAPPAASLGTNPIASFNDSDGSVTFDLKCSDDIGVSALKLYGNWSGSWSAKATNSTPTNNGFWNVTVASIPEGVWKWGAWCNDTLNQEDWSDANRTFTVDLTNPAIGSKHINESGLVNPGVIICLNVSGVSDAFGIDSVWTTVTQSNGSVFNATMSDTGSCAGSAADGWYSLNADVGDEAGTFFYNTTYVNDTHGRISYNASVLQLTVSPPSCSVDFAMSANLLQGVQFDAQDPGTANASANGNGYYEVTDLSTSGCGTVNVSVMAVDDLISGTTIIGIGNVTVNSTSASSHVIQLSKSYQLIRSGVPAGGNEVTTLYFWLSTPPGQEPKVYNTTIYVKEEKE
jgi:hypothetical protein